MKLEELIENLLVVHSNHLQKDVEIISITQDTRKVVPGSLFICLKGAHVDGHTLVKDALEKGAVAIVAEKEIPEKDLLGKHVSLIYVPKTTKALAQLANTFYNHPSSKLNLIGVTGTNGKTTVTHLISHIFKEAGRNTGLIGTMYNQINEEIIPTVNTTPDALTLQNLFHEMVEKKVSTVAMEVSSHALALGRVWGSNFSTAVFTNLTQDHLDFHGTMENYFQAKSLLFSQMGNSYETKKNAVINIDDPKGEELLPVTPYNIYTYGIKGKGVIQGKNIQVTSSGTNFDLQVKEEVYPVKSHLIGEFNVYNMLAAFGAAYANGLSPEEIIQTLENYQGTKGRFEKVPGTKELTVIVDYAHTPDGLENVLKEAQKIKTSKLICVVGAGGDRDKKKRPIMADIAVKYSDQVVFTSDNPRTEDPNEILKDMTDHLSEANYVKVVDRKEGIKTALDLASGQDIVLIAGKGHENYQIIGEVKHHFDDLEEVQHYFQSQEEQA